MIVALAVFAGVVAAAAGVGFWLGWADGRSEGLEVGRRMAEDEPVRERALQVAELESLWRRS